MAATTVRRRERDSSLVQEEAQIDPLLSAANLLQGNMGQKPHSATLRKCFTVRHADEIIALAQNHKFRAPIVWGGHTSAAAFDANEV